MPVENGRTRRASLRKGVEAAVRAVLALACLTWPAPLQASEDAFDRAMLATRVNGSPGDEVVVLMFGSEPWIEAEGLKRNGIRTFAGQRRRVDKAVFISLSTLAPDVTYVIDPIQLELRLSVAPALLGTTVVGAPARPKSDRTVTRAPAAFLNYAVNWRDQARPTVFAEAAFSAGSSVVTSTLYAAPSGQLVRGLTQAVFDDTRHLNRWTLGDRVVSAGELGGAVMLAGVVLAREYGIDPLFLRYPTVNVSGAVAAPATVEIYNNGQLVQRQDLAPGQFEVKALPVQAGRGVTRVVVRDVFGRRQEFGAPYYVATSLLAKGLHDYVYAVGVERSRPGQTSWEYGRPVAIARHRVGLTDRFTAGVRVEGSGELVSGGPSASWRFGFGEVEVGAAASRTAEGVAGAAGVLGYRYIGRRLSIGSIFRSTGRSYRTLGSRFEPGTAVREADVSASMRLGTGANLAFRHVQSTGTDIFGGTRSSVTLSTRTAGAADVFGTLSRRAGADGGTDFVVGLSRTFGGNTSFHSMRDATGDGVPTTSAEISRSLPSGTGFGYRAGWRDGVQQQTTGLFEYQNPFGRYEVSFGRGGGTGGAAFTASGALVALGGRVHATRSIQDSYALVRVPGMAGVRVYASHQEIGRTNRHGDLLVPNLLSYSVNELTIADDDVPLASAIESGGRVVVPGNRGAAVVVFPVHGLRATVGLLEIMTRDGLIVPAFGELTVFAGASQLSSPIGRQGEFYLENVPAGAHRAVVTANGRRCEFTLRADASETPQVDLGLLRCTVNGAAR